ncbi:carcinine hydrolase/isopenicillin-N N-acyltransferase family protein [uncultured Kordia sp.]|uniref:carcinine hydrolase/isopenicillin-N N-acyltransferase family protein n=1 Tax=uncultured Kordia sp. TaxID=507699 RepID=UPI002621B1D2|nr:carcinine hydrolase/isopenicillin-N N-acyltransferase family protein [uncultured Kordia sp.]
MKKAKLLILTFLLGLIIPNTTLACSVLYYVDVKTGKVYAINSEDYFLDVKAYIQIEPKTKKKFARLWYGWDNFAQGGINEKGLFFDGAVTPEQQKIKGYTNPKNNLGDKILAKCATVEEAIAFLEKEKIALDRSHIMFGDKTGKAVVVEWINGEKKLNWIQDNKLIMTNYLLAKPEAGNYPCRRHKSIENSIVEMEKSSENINLLKVGNTIGRAVQPAAKASNGKMVGTLYATFINITDNEFVLSYKLSNENIIKLDLTKEFAKSKRQKIKLKDKK